MRRDAVFGVVSDAQGTDWKAQGYCRSYGWPELWFPEGRGPGRRRQEDTAVEHCRLRCPVMERCRRYALENKETWGVWAGLRESELRKLVGKAGQ